ncbi:hypothetical protein NN561_015099 [Cricetulus griseus]
MGTESAQLLELIAKSQLTSLSGIAQKNFMNILEKVVLKVLEDQQNIRLIRELLQTLYTSLCMLVQRVGKSVLVGNINTWVYRMETILHWQQQLSGIQITRPAFKGLTFTDLPVCLQLNIMQRLSDGRDLVSLGQAAADLHVLSEDRLLWKRLCQYHFSERQTPPDNMDVNNPVQESGQAWAFETHPDYVVESSGIQYGGREVQPVESFPQGAVAMALHVSETDTRYSRHARLFPYRPGTPLNTPLSVLEDWASPSSLHPNPRRHRRVVQPTSPPLGD